MDDELVKEIEEMVNEGQRPNTPPNPPIETPPSPIETPPGETVVTTPIIPEGYVNFKEIFKGYNSPEEVIERITKSTDAETMVTTLQQQLQEVQSSSFDFGDESLYKLAQIKKKNPNDYEIATKLIFGNPDPLSLIKLARIKEHPDLKDLTDSEWNDYLQDRYGVPEFDADPDDDNYEKLKERHEKAKRSADVRLKMDAADARGSLMGILNGVEVPKPKTKEELESDSVKRINNFKTEWSPIIAGVKAELNKFKLSVPGNEGPTEFLDIDIPEELKVKYLQEVMTAFYNSNHKPDDKATGLVTNYVIERFKKDNFESILHSAIVKARALEEDSWIKLKFNATPPSKTEQVAAASTSTNKVTTESEFERRAAEHGI